MKRVSKLLSINLLLVGLYLVLATLGLILLSLFVSGKLDARALEEVVLEYEAQSQAVTPAGSSSITFEELAAFVQRLAIWHLLLMALGWIFNWLVMRTASRLFALLSALFYTIGAILGFFTLWATLLMVVLSWLGLGRQKRLN